MVSMIVVATRLGVSNAMAQNYVRSGRLAAVMQRGKYWVTNDSLDEMIEWRRTAVVAKSLSVSDANAAAELGCGTERIPVLVEQGHLVRLEGAVDGMVSVASVRCFKTAKANPFLTTGEDAMRTLALTPSEFLARVSTGDLKLVAGGLVTRASIRETAAKLWRKSS